MHDKEIQRIHNDYIVYSLRSANNELIVKKLDVHTN